MNTFPQFTACKGYTGREHMVRGFKAYLSNDGAATASGMIREQLSILSRWGIGADEQARFECVRGFAILRNALPAAFWALYHALADPALLARVRAQSRAITALDEPLRTATIDLSRLAAAPVLSAIVHEALRVHGLGTGARAVLSDTTLAGRWRLKKDCFVLLPNASVHFDKTAWGAAARAFDAGRFEAPLKSRLPPGAFQGFGGGQNACPGRHFATVEIAGLLAMMALRFDVEREGVGGWRLPAQYMGNITIAVASPAEQVAVRVAVREEFEGWRWNFQIVKEEEVKAGETEREG